MQKEKNFITNFFLGGDGVVSGRVAERWAFDGGEGAVSIFLNGNEKFCGFMQRIGRDLAFSS